MTSLRSLTLTKLIIAGTLGAAMLAGIFAAAAPARAAGLTDTQIQAVLNLLSSFNVSSDTVTQVSAALHGTPTNTPSGQTQTTQGAGGSDYTPGSQGSGQGQGAAWGQYGSGGPAAFLCGSSSVPTDNLQRGQSGAGVSQLQTFLSSHFGVASSTLVTGFFGPMTQNYLQQFQQEQGLPSTGLFGNLTSSAISRFCSGQGFGLGTGMGSTTWSGSAPGTWSQLLAIPQPGQAPLDVTFYVSSVASTTVFGIDFGDGQNSGPLASTCKAIATTTKQGIAVNATVCSSTAPHTYTASGVYTAKLMQCDIGVCSTPANANPATINVGQVGGTPLPPVPSALPAVSGSGTASTTSTVSESGTASTTSSGGVSFTVTSTSGTAPLLVYFIVNLGSTTGSYSINYGDGQTAPLTVECRQLKNGGGTYCSATMKHTYQTAGSYTASLVPPSGTTGPGSITITTH